MASSGSFNTSGYQGRYLTFAWEVQSQNTSANTTTIYWELRGAGTASSSWYKAGNFKVVIDGTTVYSSSTRIQLYNGTLVANGTRTLSHDNNGNKSFTVSAQAGIYYVAVNCSGSASFSLPQIPRYATVTQSLASKTETTITMNWKTDSEIDILWFSTDGGTNWSGGLETGTSGTYTIEYTSGENAEHIQENTTYNIVTRVRRKDSGLNSQTSALSVKTYNYPYCTSVPSFTIGNKLTLPIYNPLKRSVKMYVIANGQTNGGDTITGTSISGYYNSTWITWWYSTIPNARSGTYQVKVSYTDSDGNTHNNTTSSSGTYTINASNCIPTISSISYIDSNSNSVAITGDDSVILQYMSNLYFNFNGLSAKYSASISSLKVSINGTEVYATLSGSSTSASIDYGQINVNGTLTAIVTITDSRSVSRTINQEINVTKYTIPNALISLSRKSNYYEESYITVNADYLEIGTNAINIRFCKKKSSQDDTQYSDWVTLTDNTQYTFNADNETDWNVWVQLYDTFMSTMESPSGDSVINYHLILPRGIPIIFFDRFNNSTSFNCFPDRQNAVLSTGLALDDVILIGSQQIIDSYTLSSAGTETMYKCFNYDILENLFDGIYIPPSYERAYRITANIKSVGDNNYGYISLNNIQSRPVRTMASSYYAPQKISSTNVFKESEIELQQVSILGLTAYDGIEITATSSDGQCTFTNITIQGYLVKETTDLSEVLPQISTTLESTVILTLQRIVCDYMVANYGFADANAVTSTYTFTYTANSYQASVTTPIFMVDLTTISTSTLAYTLTVNAVSESVTDIVIN